MKKCSKCRKEKELNKFLIDHDMVDNRNSWCKDCEKEYRVKKEEERKFYRQFNII
jgi:hypothetical protein